jgi:hypothetical protein
LISFEKPFEKTRIYTVQALQTAHFQKVPLITGQHLENGASAKPN